MWNEFSWGNHSIIPRNPMIEIISHISLIRRFVFKLWKQILKLIRKKHMLRIWFSGMQIGFCRQGKMQKSFFICQLSSEKYIERRISIIINNTWWFKANMFHLNDELTSNNQGKYDVKLIFQSNSILIYKMQANAEASKNANHLTYICY